MAEFRSGTKIKDRYTLVEYKGSGTFGEVWLAHDDLLDCDIAIKIYISLNQDGINEFLSEYRITMSLSHQNLLTPQHFDVWNNRPFLIMKYCSKGSVGNMSGSLDETAIWNFIHDVAAGLDYLHSLPEPIVHQDIKPDNILLSDNGFVITDFGISKKIRSTMRKQSSRAIGAGTMAYMGPEFSAAHPQPVKASDIWALGVSIYELATGELPFCGMGGAMQRNGAEMPELDSCWSADLKNLMLACLSLETWDRPTAAQLSQYAHAKLRGTSPKAPWTKNEETRKPASDNGNKSGNGAKSGYGSNSGKSDNGSRSNNPPTGSSKPSKPPKGNSGGSGCIVSIVVTIILSAIIWGFATSQCSGGGYATEGVDTDSMVVEVVVDTVYDCDSDTCVTVEVEDGKSFHYAYVTDYSIYSNGKYIGDYTGDISDGEPHGTGSLTYVSYDPDERYQYYGQFSYGNRTNGTLTYKSGATYKGTFNNDKPWNGVITYSDGSTERVTNGNW